MNDWTPVTSWSKIEEADVQRLKDEGVREGWLREFCHNARQWYTRLCVRKPETPVWYHDPYASDFLHEHLTTSLAGSFATSIASASTAPGSSSGGGGGGFSGGGGGGGGGGGW